MLMLFRRNLKFIVAMVAVIAAVAGWCGAAQAAPLELPYQAMWTRQPGTAFSDIANGVSADSAGNVYVGGYTYGGVDGNTSAGGADICVVKYNSAGVKQWTRQMGSSSDDLVMGVCADASGNVCVTGFTFGGLDGNTSAGDWDLFVVKYDSAGVKQWTRQLGTAILDTAYGVSVDGSGNVYVTGHTGAGLDGNTSAGGADLYVVKYDSAGVKQWTRQLGTAADELAKGVAVDSDGNVYVAGYTSGGLDGNTNTGGYDQFVVKYDSAGVKQWTRLLGSAAFEYGRCVTVDVAGNVYLAGQTGGGLDGNTNAGGYDLYVVKYDSAGVKQWTRQLGSAVHDYALGVAVDAAGNAYAAGYTLGDLDGNVSAGGTDLVVVKYNTSGVKQWTRQMGTSSSDQAYGVSVDGSGNVYAAGFTSGGLNGNTNAGGDDLFLVRLVPDPYSYITSPSDGATLTNSPATIAGNTLSSNGIGFVEVSTDGGGTWQTATGTGPFSLSWNVPANGPYTLVSRATDSLAYVQPAGPAVNVTVAVEGDTTAPTSAITSPTAGATIGGAFSYVAGTSSDGSGSGVTGVEVRVDSGPWTAASDASSGTWTLQTVDTAGDVGDYTSTVVDGSGKAHISYSDATNGDLKYATDASGSWVLTAVDTDGSVGGHTSIALDGNGKVHISYYDGTNGDLKYATNASGAWVATAVDTAGSVGDRSSIAVDGNGKVHISYYDATNGDLKYATNASGSWVLTAVDTDGSVGGFTSIAVDGNGKVHISYKDNTNADLKYATDASGSWVAATVDTTGDVGDWLSQAVDGNGKAHISYYDGANGDLKYATNASGSWVLTAVDSAGQTGWYTSLALDSNGKAHISYCDVTNTNLKYATNASGSWVNSTVDAAGLAGWFTSIACDASGRVHISYEDYTNRDLKHAVMGVAWDGWSYWLDTTQLSNGSHTIYSRATDGASNVETPGAGVTVTVDNDSTAPSSSITAPTAGATILGSAYSVTGTADDGAGTGVTGVEVRVDGGAWVAATGTTSWSYSLDTTLLSNGSHTIYSRATDGSSNVETPGAGVTVTVNNLPVIDSLTPSLASPRTYGTLVTWTATASGGSGNYLYRFLRKGQDTAGMHVEVQAWGASNTYNWAPGAAQCGLNQIVVQVKNASGGVRVQVGQLYTLTAPVVPPLAVSSLTVSAGSPQPYGTPITWTATATGGTGIYRYRFVRKGPDTAGAYVEMRAMGESRTFVWTPTAAQLGANTIVAQVRDTSSVPRVQLRRDFAVSYPPIVIQSLAVSPLNTNNAASAGTPATVTATVTGNGGTGSLLYIFYRKGPDTGGTFVLLRSQSGSNTCGWTPSAAQAGTNTIKVTVSNTAGGVPVSATADFTVYSAQ